MSCLKKIDFIEKMKKTKMFKEKLMIYNNSAIGFLAEETLRGSSLDITDSKARLDLLEEDIKTTLPFSIASKTLQDNVETYLKIRQQTHRQSIDLKDHLNSAHVYLEFLEELARNENIKVREVFFESIDKTRTQEALYDYLYSQEPVEKCSVADYVASKTNSLLAYLKREDKEFYLAFEPSPKNRFAKVLAANYVASLEELVTKKNSNAIDLLLACYTRFLKDKYQDKCLAQKKERRSITDQKLKNTTQTFSTLSSAPETTEAKPKFIFFHKRKENTESSASQKTTPCPCQVSKEIKILTDQYLEKYPREHSQDFDMSYHKQFGESFVNFLEEVAQDYVDIDLLLYGSLSKAAQIYDVESLLKNPKPLPECSVGNFMGRQIQNRLNKFSSQDKNSQFCDYQELYGQYDCAQKNKLNKVIGAVYLKELLCVTNKQKEQGSLVLDAITGSYLCLLQKARIDKEFKKKHQEQASLENKTQESLSAQRLRSLSFTQQSKNPQTTEQSESALDPLCSHLKKK